MDVPDWLYEEEFLFEPRFSFQRELREASEEYEREFDASVNVKYRAEVELANNDELSRNYHRIMNLPDDQQGAEIRRLYNVTHLRPTIHQIIQKLEVSSEHLARAMSIQLREQDGLNALPVLNREMTDPKGNRVTEQEVIQIVLNELPVPDDSVPWGQIREFRSDPDSERKCFALRQWMNRFAEGRYVFTDAAEEIEDLISDYSNHLRVHRLKTAFIRLAVVFQLAAAALDRKTGPIATALVTYAFGRIAPMEGEPRAPGSEVAYIVKAAQDF